EQMRDAGKTLHDGRLGLRVGGVGMSEAETNARARKARDEAGWHFFGREREDRDALAACNEKRLVIRRWLADVARVVHARLGQRNERPFEMETENGWVSAHLVRRGERGLHFVRRIGDQGRQQRGRAELAVYGSNGARRVRSRRIVEQHIAAAIDLNI